MPARKAPATPLEGLRVLDVSTMLAGPYGATLLGDLGADVIKVESHLGDDSRRLGAMRDGECGPFLSLNRNKRAVVIDMQQPQGQDVFARLVATTDVLITNVREPALSKLGIDYESVRRHRGDVIWVGVTASSRSAASMRGRSPPGSMIAACLLRSHQTMEQFCANGVTGTVR